MSKIVAIPVLALLAAAPRAGTAGELYDAVLLGDAGAVRAQIGRGADIVDPGPLGTPLHVAAIRGDEAIADILIAGGADLEAAREDTGSRPIHDAASYGSLPIVALLHPKGSERQCEEQSRADPPSCRDPRETPGHRAAPPEQRCRHQCRRHQERRSASPGPEQSTAQPRLAPHRQGRQRGFRRSIWHHAPPLGRGDGISRHHCASRARRC